MKAAIHPEYKEIAVTCSCGNKFNDPLHHEQTGTAR